MRSLFGAERELSAATVSRACIECGAGVCGGQSFASATHGLVGGEKFGPAKWLRLHHCSVHMLLLMDADANRCVVAG